MDACCQSTLVCFVLLVACAYAAADANSRLSSDQGSWLRSRRQAFMRDSSTGNSPTHPVRGVVMKQLLYCRVGIGYHLQILPNGTVGGVHEHTEYSWLKVFAMKQGVVGIQGLRSGLYLCMNQAGISQGSDQFTAECLFRESLEENHYTTYSSSSYPGFYLALSHRGGVRRGGSVRREHPCTHFLPRIAQ